MNGSALGLSTDNKTAAFILVAPCISAVRTVPNLYSSRRYSPFFAAFGLRPAVMR